MMGEAKNSRERRSGNGQESVLGKYSVSVSPFEEDRRVFKFLQIRNSSKMLRKIYYIPRMIACSILQTRNTPQAPFLEHSLDGKLAFITGGNSGIGFETAKSLALQGCEVIILCRNPKKAEDAVNEINQLCQTAAREGESERRCQGSCQAFRLDLSDLNSVKECIETIRSFLNHHPDNKNNTDKRKKKIDYFFCNGGIMSQPYSLSPQGYEMHFATNHLGHFAIIGGLIDLLRESQSRIIIVTGDIAVWATDATPDYYYDGDGTDAYCRSKICNQSFGRELTKRYPELSVFVIHPGVVDSNLFSLPEGSLLHSIELRIRPFIMIDCEKGSQSSLYCALSKDGVIPKGSYFHNVYGICPYHETAANDEWSEKMWNLSLKLCNDAKLDLKY